uniref:PLAC8 family protein n=1 Tax=Oryza barthii TaxID=65489 RepID=A0A0D3GS94_9ORYZ
MAAAAREEEEASTAARSRQESEGEEEEVMAVLDFDMLCASVALAAERRKDSAAAAAATVEAGGGGGGGGGGGVQRMWEGDVVLDCLEDRRIALEAACCPCYRFGKNMRRANLGSCFLQAMVYLISLVAILVSLIAFSVTRHNIYLYMGLSSVLLIAIYTGYFRRRIRKQFNIRGTDSSLDDCVLHLICPCCTLCQEARTLEINNVQCGVWHGRGDTICLGSNGEGNKAFAALHKSSFVPIKSPELCGMDRTSNGANEHEPLVLSDLPEQ